MGRCRTLLILFIILLFASCVQAYEGFGSVTNGSADNPGGETVVTVNSLADTDTVGTLRYWLVGSGAAAGNKIEFSVGGTISAASAMKIHHRYITIDGSTAPDPGITINMVNGDAFEIEAGSGQGTLGDTIINNIRFLGPTDGTGGDTIALNAYAAGSKGITRVVIDNCTMGYGGDSCCDIVGDVNEVTISWNFFYRSNRPMLLNQGANGNEVRENISIHHNVYGFCDERQPQIQYTNTTIDFVNNVVYGWGWERGVVGALKFSIGGSASNPSMNVTNNYYKYVANVFNPDEDEAIWWSGGTPFGDVYFSGNTFPAGENDETSTTGSAISISQSVTTYAASTLGDNVVPTVGTQYPTQFEKNMLDTIATDIGGNPDTIVPGEAAL